MCNNWKEIDWYRLGSGSRNAMMMWCLLVSVATMEDVLRRLEQRLDEQASEIVALRSKVAFLQDDGKAGTDSLFVTLDGRLLSHDSAVAVCCRWTPDSTCGVAVEADLYRTCTGLHEYLEAKTTTYEFADVANAQCLGPTSSNWKWEYNGHHGNVTLKSGATATVLLKCPPLLTPTPPASRFKSPRP